MPYQSQSNLALGLVRTAQIPDESSVLTLFVSRSPMLSSKQPTPAQGRAWTHKWGGAGRTIMNADGRKQRRHSRSYR